MSQFSTLGIPQRTFWVLVLVFFPLVGCRDSRDYTAIAPQVFQEQYALSEDLEPAQVGIQLLRHYRQEPEGRRGEQLELRYPAAGEAELLFTVEGLADDSVQARRFRLKMRWSEEVTGWQMESVGSQQRCWPGRGPQNWSNQPCV
jgi:hypothetical protein